MYTSQLTAEYFESRHARADPDFFRNDSTLRLSSYYSPTCMRTCTPHDNDRSAHAEGRENERISKRVPFICASRQVKSA